MAEISRSALLPYPAERVYELINDVAAYPQYMDGCVGAQVLQQGSDFMEARLDLAKAGLKYSLTTRNRLQAPSSVEMVLVNGPFESFNGLWTIQPLGETACKVSLVLRFTMASKVLGAAAKLLFNPMADNLVDALVQRAHHLYQHQ
ncbi:MAG: type II toxin-antitoxin system RatA family toxin [Spongiibacteraceae bacterium]